jgi:hypothetical protein
MGDQKRHHVETPYILTHLIYQVVGTQYQGQPFFDKPKELSDRWLMRLISD